MTKSFSVQKRVTHGKVEDRQRQTDATAHGDGHNETPIKKDEGDRDQVPY